MKKLLLILPFMALAACNQNTYVHDANEYVKDCEKIVTSEMGGDIYKCPMTEDLVAVKAMEADSAFGLSADLDIATVAADAKNAYVNVFGGKCETEGQVSYRVIVNTPKTVNDETYYAVEVCR